MTEVESVDGVSRGIIVKQYDFFDAEGVEIQPRGEISVTITFDMTEASADTVMVHLQNGVAEIVSE